MQIFQHHEAPVTGDGREEAKQALADLHRAGLVGLLAVHAPLRDDLRQRPPVDRRPAGCADPPDEAGQRLEQRTKRHGCRGVNGTSHQHR